MKTVDIRDLGEYKSLMESLHNRLEDLESEFKKIQTLFDIDVSDDNFNVAISSFYFIFDVVPLMSLTMKPDEIDLFRARVNQKNVLFDSASEISYNRARPDLIEAGRFNQPKQPVFYASLPVEKGKVVPYLAACFETCKGLIDKDNLVNLLDFTIGRWKVTQPFHVINLCFDPEHLQYSPSLNFAVQSYFNGLASHMSVEAFAFVKRFLGYFSEMSGRQSLQKREYYILTALFYAIRFYYKKHYEQDVYGLVFSSAATEKNGLNVVVMPDAADNCLELDVIIMYRFFRDDKTFVADKCSDMVRAVNGTFNITGFQQIPDRKSYG